MNREEILTQRSMPVFSPSYPRGTYRFMRREYLFITYEPDRDALRRALPEPLEPLPENLVFYEWMKVPDASGFGDYEEGGTGAFATYEGEPCNFSGQMHLVDEPPITAGREIWGFPKKWGSRGSTCARTRSPVRYDEERVAMGTMTYQHKSLEHDLGSVKAGLGKLNVKLLLDVDGGPKVAQLVGYRLEDITVHGAWDGEARLDLIPRVNCHVADLPVRRIVGARHMVIDFTLPFGQVLHDYLA